MTVKSVLFFFIIGLVQVFADLNADLESIWKSEFSDIAGKISNRSLLAKSSARNELNTPEEEMLDRNALILETDRGSLDVALRRIRALLDRLKTGPAASDALVFENQVDSIVRAGSGGLAKLSAAAAQDEDVYLSLRKIARQALFSDPLVDFDAILYTERRCYRTGDFGGQHLTMNYLGHLQAYGGGLYVVSGFKSGNPEIRNVTEGAVITNGKWQGQKLEGGAFMSPELSFDGKEILFAYVKPYYKDHAGERSQEYNEDNSFHLFKINTDGTRLVQLTWGNQNDFDPCYLPNGRIVFNSTRTSGRGNNPDYPFMYSRCFYAPSPPQFTMHSMKLDGTDIYPISFHETDEFHPSLTNDGMLVYSRWDYADKDAGVMQHLWTCYPDGRDPRAPHGNYPLPHSTMDAAEPSQATKRPFAEFHIRAIPRGALYQGSSKFVATAAPHHGEPFGAVVLIDISVPDDNLMSQVKRITANPFPEAEVGQSESWEYGTPFPLSEDLYLVDWRGGLYLLDKSGNKELICNVQNSKLRIMEPIPLKPRVIPLAIPTQTYQGERAAPDAPNATVSVMNAYIADKPWPEGTVLKELRIVQLFIKPTMDMNDPKVGYHGQSMARMVLGTVPVEEDGSIYFEAPVNKTLSFQLLDQNGIMVNGMRTDTYVHQGEKMTCVGCHESKWEAIPVLPQPKAMRRAPSKIQPEVGGVEPINFYRLVKPVFDLHCTPCHIEKRKGPDMSHASLKPYAAFYSSGEPGWRSLQLFRVGGSRTDPGKSGTYGAPLYKGGYLTSSHYNVSISAEELRRITTWLDNNSNEFGAYTNAEAQAKGELVWPVFDVDPENPLDIERHTAIYAQGKKEIESFSLIQNKSKITILLPQAGSWAVRVVSPDGRTWFRIEDTMSKQEFSFSKDGIPPGLYFIQIRAGKKKMGRPLFLW
ncbi:MAG: hypothetical protein HQK83_14810 [Fibrobacteria bacterium]|nr:hypothetical protein [Fibrobacteria bacterium]